MSFRLVPLHLKLILLLFVGPTMHRALVVTVLVSNVGDLPLMLSNGACASWVANITMCVGEMGSEAGCYSQAVSGRFWKAGSEMCIFQ